MLKGRAPNIILFDISDSLFVSIDAIGPVGTLCSIIWLSTELTSGSTIQKVTGRNKINHRASPNNSPYTGVYWYIILFESFLNKVKGIDTARPIILPEIKCNNNPNTIMLTDDRFASGSAAISTI